MSETPTPEPEIVEEHVIDPESKIWGVSIRGIIALILILTLCSLSFLAIEVKEPLYTLVSTVVAFYFGHQTAVKQNRR